MLRWSAPNPDGFTLLETIFTLAIVGVVMAMAVPSLFAAYQRAQLTEARDLIIGSLREAQQTAAQKHGQCQIVLDSTAHRITSSDGCLPTGDRQLSKDITLGYNGIGDKINYGLRGNTTTNKSIFVGIKNTDRSQQLCISISAPLGIIRTGVVVYLEDHHRQCQKA
jgi:prepilin-type N-terminal cleavage/methylation domain-containing protein